MNEVFENSFNCNQDVIEPGNPNDLMDEFFNSEIGIKAINKFYDRGIVQDIISRYGMDYLVSSLTDEHDIS